LDPPPPPNPGPFFSLPVLVRSLQWILSVCVRGEKEKEKKAFELNVKTFLLGVLKLSTFCFNAKNW
jgi:hypothetical protein